MTNHGHLHLFAAQTTALARPASCFHDLRLPPAVHIENSKKYSRHGCYYSVIQGVRVMQEQGERHVHVLRTDAEYIQIECSSWRPMHALSSKLTTDVL